MVVRAQPCFNMTVLGWELALYSTVVGRALALLLVKGRETCIALQLRNIFSKKVYTLTTIGGRAVYGSLW